jgi:hypothetical protein
METHRLFIFPRPHGGGSSFNKEWYMKTGYVKGLVLIALVLAMVLAACSQPTGGGGGGGGGGNTPAQSDLTGTWITQDAADYIYRVIISGTNYTMTRRAKVGLSDAWENREKGTITVSGKTVTRTLTHKADQQGAWVPATGTGTGTLANDGKSFKADVNNPYTYWKQ